MINKNEVARFLSDIINEGIGLSPLNRLQRIEYLERLHEFINNEGAFNSYLEDNRIVIETFIHDPILAVDLENESIFFIPISDSDWLDPLLTVLRFVRIAEIEETYKEELTKKEIEEANKQFDWI